MRCRPWRCGRGRGPGLARYGPEVGRERAVRLWMEPERPLGWRDRGPHAGEDAYQALSAGQAVAARMRWRSASRRSGRGRARAAGDRAGHAGRRAHQPPCDRTGPPRTGPLKPGPVRELTWTSSEQPEPTGGAGALLRRRRGSHLGVDAEVNVSHRARWCPPPARRAQGTEKPDSMAGCLLTSLTVLTMVRPLSRRWSGTARVRPQDGWWSPCRRPRRRGFLSLI